MNAARPYPKTLVEAVEIFADEDVAHAFMVGIRWPGGVTCPRCQCPSVGYISTRRKWTCKGCKKQFTVKVGTVFEDSPIAIGKWLIAMWLESSAKNSISSYEVHRAIGVTQKTAWFMQQRIRLAMQSGTFTKMTGGVEVDETFIGGKARNMHKEKRARVISGTGGAGKTAVMGLLERHGPDGHSRVRAKVVGNTKRKTLQPVVREHVEPGSQVFTDAHSAYAGLAPDFVHQFIDHAETYARGNVHTNGLENFWSLFKRCIKGTHVSVEPFHLFRYLDAECFRFNNRKTDDGTRFLRVAGSVAGKRLTYKALIGALADAPLV